MPDLKIGIILSINKLFNFLAPALVTSVKNMHHVLILGEVFFKIFFCNEN